MKAREIISKIYVDAHVKEFSNGVEYFGSLSPERAESVKRALLALKEMVLRLKEKCSHTISNKPVRGHFCSGCRRHNQAIDSVAGLFND